MLKIFEAFDLEACKTLFLVIMWELGNMMVEKKIVYVWCYYGLVIEEYNLIQFGLFFGSSFLDPLILKYAEHP